MYFYHRDNFWRENSNSSSIVVLKSTFKRNLNCWRENSNSKTFFGGRLEKALRHMFQSYGPYCAMLLWLKSQQKENGIHKKERETPKGP